MYKKTSVVNDEDVNKCKANFDHNIRNTRGLNKL